ncbi:hypothetical protein BGZ58_010133 [Dissophora ornata]|nr:hypothetical protein BGZ58_010133 [Dissophora ornata]
MSALLRIASLHSRTSLLPTASATNRLSLATVLPPRTRTWITHTFSTSLPSAQAIVKKPLSKKIAIPKDPYKLSEKIVKFSKNGKLDDAVNLVLATPKSRQSEVVWNHLIQESSKLGKASQSWQLLSDMKKRGFEPNERTYTILLNALAINTSSPNSVPRAMTLYQEMKDSEDTPPTRTHINALLKVCARKPDHGALQKVYGEMPKSGPNAPDVVTFNILINSFAREGGDKGFEMAWKVWGDCLEAKTRRPDEVNLDEALVDAILLACREAKSSAYIKRGYRLVESLYGLSLSVPGSGGPPTISATDKTISPSKALGLGTILKKDTIQPRTVELLLSICTKLKDYGKAERYMDLIRETYPSFTPDSQLLSSLMHLQITTKEYQKAIETWDEINRLNLQHTPATFKQGLDASLKARNWEKTSEMYTEMRRQIKKNKSFDMRYHRPINPIVHQQDAWTLVSTLKCAVKTKHIPEAVEILRETHWTKVVQSSRYPRANADMAELAVKIYTSALKALKFPKTIDGSDSPPPHVSTPETYQLENELQGAKNLQLRLKDALTRHDEEMDRKEAEEMEEIKNRRAQRYSSEPVARHGEEMEEIKNRRAQRYSSEPVARGDFEKKEERRSSRSEISRGDARNVTLATAPRKPSRVGVVRSDEREWKSRKSVGGVGSRIGAGSGASTRTRMSRSQGQSQRQSQSQSQRGVPFGDAFHVSKAFTRSVF